MNESMIIVLIISEFLRPEYLKVTSSLLLKSLTKKTVNKASNFQLNIQRLCKKKKYKGLLCGHTHLPQIKQNSDYIYFNTGDWIEACTAITEDRDGSFELKSFSKAKSILINKL